MISSNQVNKERGFLICFFCGDETIKIFERKKIQEEKVINF